MSFRDLANRGEENTMSVLVLSFALARRIRRDEAADLRLPPPKCERKRKPP